MGQQSREKRATERTRTGEHENTSTGEQASKPKSQYPSAHDQAGTPELKSGGTPQAQERNHPRSTTLIDQLSNAEPTEELEVMTDHQCRPE